ncbi:TPA: winged helix-turn-helix transcriptional regulator [Serratia odorifera]
MNENKKNKQFLMVGYEILKINELVVNGKKVRFSDTSKNLYCYIKNWPDAFPSHNKIAEVFGITRKAVEQRIKKLVDLGLIERIERPGRSNRYYVKPITEDMVTGRSYSENKGTRHEDRSGSAAQNPTKPSQESPAETTDKRQPQQVKDPAEAIASHDDFDALLCRPSAKHSPAALLEGLLGGDDATPASKTPTTSAVDYDDWNSEPF